MISKCLLSVEKKKEKENTNRVLDIQNTETKYADKKQRCTDLFLFFYTASTLYCTNTHKYRRTNKNEILIVFDSFK